LANLSAVSELSRLSLSSKLSNFRSIVMINNCFERY
jgi:hypothetical protein